MCVQQHILDAPHPSYIHCFLFFLFFFILFENNFVVCGGVEVFLCVYPHCHPPTILFFLFLISKIPWKYKGDPSFALLSFCNKFKVCVSDGLCFIWQSPHTPFFFLKYYIFFLNFNFLFLNLCHCYHQLSLPIAIAMLNIIIIIIIIIIDFNHKIQTSFILFCSYFILLLFCAMFCLNCAFACKHNKFAIYFFFLFFGKTQATQYKKKKK